MVGTLWRLPAPLPFPSIYHLFWPPADLALGAHALHIVHLTLAMGGFIAKGKDEEGI